MAAVDLDSYTDIDWDPDDEPDGNLAHCMQPRHLGSNPERVVYEVLSEQPVEVKFKVQTAAFAVVGPDFSRSSLWLILFDESHKRPNWLRPVTGWRAEIAEQRMWEQRCGKLQP